MLKVRKIIEYSAFHHDGTNALDIIRELKMCKDINDARHSELYNTILINDGGHGELVMYPDDVLVLAPPLNEYSDYSFTIYRYKEFQNRFEVIE